MVSGCASDKNVVRYDYRRIGGIPLMISGARAAVNGKHAEAGRGYFREIFGLASVDARHGCPIFAVPAAEAGLPVDENRRDLYFMCGGLNAEMAALRACHEMTMPSRRGGGGPKRVHTSVNAARMSACATTP
jgi:hypothetical protein